MTITKNTDCTIITLTDPLYEYFKNSEFDVTSVTIHYSVNGGDEETYEVETADVTDGAIALDTTFFNQTTETLVDGVYCFRVVVSQDENDLTSYGNILIDCALLCSLATYVWNNPTKQLHAKYEAIKYFQQCNSCDCTTVYKLYQDLLIDLDITINQDCGC